MAEFATILVTTDLSKNSLRAFPPAFAIARRFASRVVAVHVVEDRLPPLVDEFTAMPVEEILDSRVARASEELGRLLGTGPGEGVEVERVILHGTPHLEIVRLAEERRAELIVMATHGHGFVSHALFGSTTERVLRRAPCPVLTVRGGE